MLFVFAGLVGFSCMFVHVSSFPEIAASADGCLISRVQGEKGASAVFFSLGCLLASIGQCDCATLGRTIV